MSITGVMHELFETTPNNSETTSPQEILENKTYPQIKAHTWSCSELFEVVYYSTASSIAAKSVITVNINDSGTVVSIINRPDINRYLISTSLSEIARSTNFGLPERFANHVRGSTSFHSTTTHYEDGTRSIFILGYGLAHSVGVVNTYDSGGALMHVSALRAEAIDQSVSITDRYATVMPRSGVCKNWDRTCQESKIRNCPNGWCGTLL